MTIGDRIFERLGEIGMTQKEFSEKTGISQSTISEWKSKRTNPTSEKIMIICDTLNVTPEWILSGSSKTGNRGNELPWYVIDRSTELGRLVSQYRELDEKQRARVMGPGGVAGDGWENGVRPEFTGRTGNNKQIFV